MTNNTMPLPKPDADESGPYSHLGFCRAKPGEEDRVEALILELVARIRRSPGHLACHVHRDRADRSAFVIYEVFRSIGDLQVHLAQPHSRQFIENIAPLAVGPLRQQFLRMVSHWPGDGMTRS